MFEHSLITKKTIKNLVEFAAHPMPRIFILFGSSAVESSIGSDSLTLNSIMIFYNKCWIIYKVTKKVHV